jgi:hypothetical protein
MMTLLGRSNTPSLLGLHPTNLPQTFASSSQHQKALSDVPIPSIHPLLPSSQPLPPATSKKFTRPSPTLPHTHSPPVVVPPTFYRRRDHGIGTVKIGSKQGKILCFLAIACIELHDNLTNPSQPDVHTQPNPSKLPKPSLDIQKHCPTCPSCSSIHHCLPDSHRHISEAAPHPISCCGGSTNLLSHSYTRECI